MKNTAQISAATAVLGGAALGATSLALSGAVFSAVMGPLSLVPVLGALMISAAVPGFLLRRPGEPLDEFSALDLIEDEVWLIEKRSGIFRYVNAAAALRSGFAAGQDTNAKLHDIVPADQQVILVAVIKTPDTPQDIRIGAKQFRARVIPVHGGRFLMITLRDVTRMRHDEAAKDDFISTVSHELRSPLTSIKGSMGLLLSNAAGELPKPARKLLEIAHRNAERLVLIINDILDLQKITAGGMAIDAQDVDLAELVHEAIAASALFMKRFDLDTVVVGADAFVPLRSDPNRIIQVLGNLLTNAAKFSKPRGKITVTLAQQPGGVTISVADEGVGIPQTEQDKVFERFADMTNSNRQQNGGSGLGLSICKAIIETLGGRIRFESIEEVGTTFEVFLPREEILEHGHSERDDIRNVG